MKLAHLALPMLAACASVEGAPPLSPPDPPPPKPHGPAPLAAPYAEVSRRIIARALADDGAYQKLEYLTDRIGHRLSGSEALDRAIEWAVKTMEEDRLEQVRKEKVIVPKWVRGEERGSIVAPIDQRLHLLGLGGTIATPEKGITAPVIVVRSFPELEANAARVAGRIVLFDVALPPYGPKGSGYGEVVAYRGRGPLRAAQLGAVGALVRSVTAHSLRTPHTGSTRFEESGPKIPAAAVSVEDAALIARLSRTQTVAVHLQLGAKQFPDVESANVIGELRGRELPEEIVLLGAHLDSWDVGQGAHDDGAGCVMIMEALRLLRALELRPRRTIRVVLYTNEENGLEGAKAYARDHAAELAKHVAAIESDTGGFRPLGFRVEAGPAHLAEMAELVTLLDEIGANRAIPGYSGADIGALKPSGVPLLGFDMESSKYFDYHHSEADTLDKVSAEDLRYDVAALAVTAYALAELPQPLGHNLEK